MKARLIDNNYSDEAISNAIKLFNVLGFPVEFAKKKTITTAWGRKTEEGVINTILAIMYPIEDNEKISI